MTGRELIMYITENHLEDTEIIFVNIEDTSKILGVNTATVRMLIERNILTSFIFEDKCYIPLNAINFLIEKGEKYNE